MKLRSPAFVRTVRLAVIAAALSLIVAGCVATPSATTAEGTASPAVERSPIPSPSATAVSSPTATAGIAPSPTATVAPPHAIAGPDAPRPMAVISRGAPAFASSKSVDAPRADDADYATEWRSYTLPAWLAYDLSGVPAARRGKVVVVYYNNSYGYDLSAGPHYNNAGAYSIQANPAARGPFPPDDGWVTLVTVTDNTFHSRQHVVDLTGYNWVRIRVSSPDGAPKNSDIAINLDVHDASGGMEDDWIWYGDALTTQGMATMPVGGADTFAKLVNTALPDHFPVAEDGGIPNQTTADGAARIATWLAMFPGRYVGLAFGTKDAANCSSPDAFFAHYAEMVQAVLSAGKVPVIPTIPWAPDAGVERCGPTLNAKIRALYAAYPAVVRGPDLWTFYATHPSLIPTGDIHPTEAGYGAYRRQWADAMLATVYHATTPVPASATPEQRSSS